MRSSRFVTCFAMVVLACGCGDGGSDVDGGLDPGDAGVDGATPDAAMPDASTSDAATSDGSVSDGEVDASVASSCLDEGHVAGERFPVGDDCNFCDCLADGSRTCTDRTCPPSRSGCTYGGVDRAYAERFPATDGCNECVCAASGLACTRRACAPTIEESAILLESANEPCGDDPAFTGQSVLAGLPDSELMLPFLYERDRDAALYPETRADTTLTLRIVYDGGYTVCRIPSPGQEAIDIEVLTEWITADGAFDETLHTYLRHNATGFVTPWTTVGSLEVGELNGTYTPACLDPAGFSFAATFDPDGTGGGAIHKTCETDISLVVGSFALVP